MLLSINAELLIKLSNIKRKGAAITEYLRLPVPAQPAAAVSNALFIDSRTGDE